MFFPHRHWTVHVLLLLLGGGGGSPSLTNMTIDTGADLTLDDSSAMEVA